MQTMMPFPSLVTHPSSPCSRIGCAVRTTEASVAAMRHGAEPRHPVQMNLHLRSRLPTHPGRRAGFIRPGRCRTPAPCAVRPWQSL